MDGRVLVAYGMSLLPGLAPRSRAPQRQRPRAADEMVSVLVVIVAWAPVASLIAGARPGGVYPVVNAGGALVGTLDLGAVASQPELHDRLAGEVCRPVEALSVLGPHDRVVPERLPGLVLDQGRLVGVLPSRPGPATAPHRQRAS